MQADSASQIRALANRFFNAIERGDAETVLDCYASNAVIWHNIDNREKSRDENLLALKGMMVRIENRRYEQRRLQVSEHGFVQQHELHGTRTLDGQTVILTACIVCTVVDGQITRLDEYLDSAQVAEFRKQSEPTPPPPAVER